jgi:hypothetical protein
MIIIAQGILSIGTHFGRVVLPEFSVVLCRFDKDSFGVTIDGSLVLLIRCVKNEKIEV